MLAKVIGFFFFFVTSETFHFLVINSDSRFLDCSLLCMLFSHMPGHVLSLIVMSISAMGM